MERGSWVGDDVVRTLLRQKEKEVERDVKRVFEVSFETSWRSDLVGGKRVASIVISSMRSAGRS